MGLTLRPARDEDVPFLAPIELAGDQLFVEAGHPEFGVGTAILHDVAHLAISEGRLTVAELDGEIVGWTCLSPVRDELELDQISVHPRHHRRGIGAALLESVVEGARTAGAPSITLNTQDDVPWNRPWYERHGFVVVPEADWTDHMRSVAAEQAREGLDWTTRVHMRRMM